MPAAPLTAHGLRSQTNQLAHIVKDSGARAILMDAETRHLLTGDGSVDAAADLGLRHVDHQRILATRHADVDLGQQAGVQQRAVQRAVGVVDFQASAQRVERVGLAGEHFPGHDEAVGDRRDEGRQLGPAQTLELLV